jgi:D-alanyl-D-alanine carboxypeptidase
LTSLHRDGRSLVAVVMGGRTAASRDATMESLLADHVAQASTRRTAGSMIAQAEPTVPLQLAAATPPARPAIELAAVAADVPAPPARPAATQLAEGDNSADDDEEDGAPRAAAVLPPAKIAARVAPPAPQPAAPVRLAEATPEQLGWIKGPDPVDPAKAQATLAAAMLAANPTEAKPAAPAPVAAAPAARPREESEIARDDETRAGDRSGWVVQIGISDDETKANDLLIQARAKNPGALASAKPFTEKVKKGEDVFYRARFAGLDSATAETACRSLKKSGFPCFAAHD